MKTTIHLFCVLLLLSCSNNDRQRSYNPLDYGNGKVDIIELGDTISVNGIKWIIRGNVDFQPIAIEAIDQQEQILYQKIKSYKETVLRKVNPDKIPAMKGVNHENPSLLLKQALEENDYDLYMDILIRNLKKQESEFYDMPYTLYMAEKNNGGEAYYRVWEHYRRNKKANGKVVWNTLDDVGAKNKQLALYCLIKSFQAGCYFSVDILSLYYKEGRYFPQNDTVCHFLNSISKSNSEYLDYISWKRERERESKK